MKPLTPSEATLGSTASAPRSRTAIKRPESKPWSTSNARGLVVIGLGTCDADTTITLTDLGVLAYRVDAAARAAWGS